MRRNKIAGEMGAAPEAEEDEWAALSGSAARFGIERNRRSSRFRG